MIKKMDDKSPSDYKTFIKNLRQLNIHDNYFMESFKVVVNSFFLKYEHIFD